MEFCTATVFASFWSPYTTIPYQISTEASSIFFNLEAPLNIFFNLEAPQRFSSTWKTQTQNFSVRTQGGEWQKYLKFVVSFHIAYGLMISSSSQLSSFPVAVVSKNSTQRSQSFGEVVLCQSLSLNGNVRALIWSKNCSNIAFYSGCTAI
jgi:hypothetical protein